jgi:hypothetical protein
VEIKGSFALPTNTFTNCVNLKYVILHQALTLGTSTKDEFRTCVNLIAVYVADSLYEASVDISTPMGTIMGSLIAAGKVKKLSERVPESIIA